MPVNKSWVEEQEEAIELFRGLAGASDALKMLEHSETNRDLSAQQARLHTVSRILYQVTGITFYKELPVTCEKAQMNVDNSARKDYQKIAIEQYQAKLASRRNIPSSFVGGIQ